MKYEKIANKILTNHKVNIDVFLYPIPNGRRQS